MLTANYDLDPILTLSRLDTEMASKQRSARALSAYTPGLDPTTIADLASKDARRVREPWLSEAYTLARMLGCDDICTLIGQTLADIALTEDARGDLHIWRTGCELPLSHAVRLCQRFGLRDPYDLYEVIRMRQRNPVITSTMTMPASDECSACGGTGPKGHTDTCIPGFLWGPRDADVVETIGLAPIPRKPGKRQNGVSRLGYGLHPLRLRLRVSKQNMAANVLCSYEHYTKMERLKVPLTEQAAQSLSRKFGVTAASLWEVPAVLPTPTELAAEPEA